MCNWTNLPYSLPLSSLSLSLSLCLSLPLSLSVSLSLSLSLSLSSSLSLSLFLSLSFTLSLSLSLSLSLLLSSPFSLSLSLSLSQPNSSFFTPLFFRFLAVSKGGRPWTTLTMTPHRLRLFLYAQLSRTKSVSWSQEDIVQRFRWFCNLLTFDCLFLNESSDLFCTTPWLCQK